MGQLASKDVRRVTEEPGTRPESSRTGDMVSEISRRRPSLVTRIVSK
jgi:hypothetical protein